MKKYLCTVFVIIFADQITKFWVKSNIAVGRSVLIVGDWLKLTHIRNSGAAFSMMTDRRIFLIVFPSAVVIIALLYMFRHRNSQRLMLVAMSLVIGGGLGNLVDRIRLGYVTDMFSISFFPSIFNVADIAVTTGCVLLIIYIIFFMKSE